jgi:hypothetical protein
VGAIIPPPFTSWQLRAQRLIKNSQTSQTQFPNNSPITVTKSITAANPTASTIITDAGVSPAITPFVAPNIIMSDARFTLCNGFNMTNQGSGNFLPSYMPLESSNTSAMGWAFVFGSDAEAIGICVRGGGTGNAASAIRVKIDGQWAAAAQVIPSGFSNFYEVKYSLGTGNGGPHTWKVYCTNNSITGVNAGLAAGSTAANNPYTIWDVVKFDTPMVVCLTDSYGGSMPLDTNTNDPHQPFVIQLADWMGWDSIIPYASAGQGYIAGGVNNGSLKFSQTLNALPTGLPAVKTADLVIIAMGYNDIAGSTANQIGAACLAALPSVRSTYPNAYICVWGTWNTPTHNSTNAIDTAIHNAVASFNDPYTSFFSTMGQYNNLVAYQFPGNSAWVTQYIQSDNVHETDVGGRRVAHRMAQDLIEYLRTQTGINLATP